MFFGRLSKHIWVDVGQRDQSQNTLSHAQGLKFCLMVNGICGLPWRLSSKEPPANAGNSGSLHESGRSRREGNGNLLQCSGLENPMDRGAWWATVHGVTRESEMI